MDCSCQVPPSMGFSRRECWSGLPFLLQGIFPTQGSNLGLHHCRQTLPSELPPSSIKSLPVPHTDCRRWPLWAFEQRLFGSDGKLSARNVGDPGLIPGSGRSPGEENGNPLQYSCLENPMDRGAWASYSPWGHKESDMTKLLTHTHTHTHTTESPCCTPETNRTL